MYLSSNSSSVVRHSPTKQMRSASPTLIRSGIARTPERGTSVGVRGLSREDLRNAVGLVSLKDNAHSVENRLQSLHRKGEEWATKGIQYDPHDLPKNSLLCFSLFQRSRYPILSIQYLHSILYDFPIPQEYVPLKLLPDVLQRMPNKSVFIMTVLSGKDCIHANLIFINKQQNRIEIFDPLGKTADAEFRKERDLQESILREFICNAECKYELYCEIEAVGIQTMDSKWTKKREGEGFCRVWVWLVAKLCAEFPTKSMREIVGQLTEWVADSSSVNICRGFLAETREYTYKMMHTKSGFSKLYLELREKPVQSGKARNAYRLSEKLAMEYLQGVR